MKALPKGHQLESRVIQPTKNHERPLVLELWPDPEAPRKWVPIEGVPFPGGFEVIDRVRLKGAAEDPRDLLGAIERARTGESGLTLHVWYTFAAWDTAVRCVGVQFSITEDPAAGESPTTEDMTTGLFKHAEIDRVRRRAIEYFTQLHSLTADQPTQRRTARSIERRSNAVKPDLIFKAATIYNQHIDGTPLKAVRERLGISKSTSEKYIRLAREAGYVTESAKPGRRQQQP
ncbi:hypothetical protein NMQ03_07905 [Arthrobacter sp. DNA4]|uniref:hypothetical protein n=1 Tax=Arthrobacter sp. DNA4 TaxID=2963432 RepID=UPI0020CDC5FD|nr:hypothetical protein [Arthrobacter sp. DNA4]UTT71013.1 hypothetical protein NMQ03_07905 [Arthrobacter sp. DNA4]